VSEIISRGIETIAFEEQFMDILDRLVKHDAWTTRQLMVRCQGLSDDQLDRQFDIGHRTLRETLVHMIWNMEAWTDVICEKPVRQKPPANPQTASVVGLMHRLDAAAPELEATARKLADTGRLDDTWLDNTVQPPVRRTFGSIIVHLITHSMHHRAHVLWIMRRLGVKDLIEGDVLSWEEETKRR
jgi:uncharacterized damage-inducible protein DinB